MPNHEVAQAWTELFIGLLCIFSIVQIIQHLRERHHAHVVSVSKEAIKLYVKTGNKTPAFSSLNGSLVTTAEKLRSDYVEEERRDRENHLIDMGFQLICECPRCKTFDMHHMSGNTSGRQCTKCGYTWHVPT